MSQPYLVIVPSTFTVNRSHLIYGLCLPLALLLGYLLASPLESSSMAVVVLVMSVLITPLLMRWYHPVLVILWNSTFYFPLLPGAPPAWIALTMLGAMFMLLNRCVDPKRRLMAGGHVAWALLAMMLVVGLTAVVTGGVGLRVLGSATYGGRKYVYLIAAMIGFFVLTSQRIPKARAALFVSLFFISGATTVIGDLAERMGGQFQAVYFFVSPDTVTVDAASSYDAASPGLVRRTGWVNISSAVCLFALARFGLKGILDLKRPWRLAATVFFMAAGLYGGFRSFIGFILLAFAISFFLEGLHRTRYLLVAVLAGTISIVGLAAMSTKLPLSVQRSLSFLPIEISPAAATAAKSTLTWRFDMWKEVVNDVPQYLLKGKGYVIDPSELFFSQVNSFRGFDLPSEWAIVAGDYHNGPLSVLIPFGIWGALAFGGFLFFSVRLMLRYCAHGDPALRLINRALLACFIARLVFFLFLVGGLAADLPYFVSLIGLAVSINGKVSDPANPESGGDVPDREVI